MTALLSEWALIHAKGSEPYGQCSPHVQSIEIGKSDTSWVGHEEVGELYAAH